MYHLDWLSIGIQAVGEHLMFEELIRLRSSRLRSCAEVGSSTSSCDLILDLWERGIIRGAQCPWLY